MTTNERNPNLPRPVRYVESVRWRNDAGRTASVHGALPYLSDAQRIAEGWRTEVVGWSPMWKDGTIGGGRVPHKTLEEAVAFYGDPMER